MAVMFPVEKKLPQIPDVETDFNGSRLKLEKKILNDTILKVREKMRELDKEHHILINALAKYKAQKKISELKDNPPSEPSKFKNYLTEPKSSNLNELLLCKKEVAQINQTKLKLNQEFRQYQEVESDESDS